MTLKQQVYTDDLEVDLLIDGNEWNLLECRVELSRSDTPDYVDMRIKPTPNTQEIIDALDDPTKTKNNGGLLGTDFVLEVDNELQAGERVSSEFTNITDLVDGVVNNTTDPIDFSSDTLELFGDEQKRIFSGTLANLSTAGQGSWEAIAYDPSHQVFERGQANAQSGNFLNSKIDIEKPVGDTNSTEAKKRKTVSYPEDSQNPPEGYKIEASRLAKQILLQTQLPADSWNVRIKDGGYTIGVRDDGSEITAGEDVEIKFSERNVHIYEALDKIRNRTKSVTWFDSSGNFYIGAALPGDPVRSWEVQFITDTTAGSTTPAWNAVRVIGSGIVSGSDYGWERSNMNSTNKVTALRRIGSNGAALEIEEDLDDPVYTLGVDGTTFAIENSDIPGPVYTYRNMEIQTQAEADAVAEQIVSKLHEQQATGSVTVVGFPEIRPLDAITMPQASDSTDTNYNPLQPMGGTKYSVVKVIHKINSSDGFITEITVGGITKEAKVVDIETYGENDRVLVPDDGEEGLVGAASEE